MIDWSSTFADALPYQSFLDRYASPPQRMRWDAMHERFSLTAEQQTLLERLRAADAGTMPGRCLVW